ncbi:hypothetical protein AAFF_G00063910 [Aldrovandia affinis]|uniref:Uncharacterized protein n=1 Tax=Aldrovandia affinis TaxID=143900 RepID=A0AAD7T4I4_9TELE|nr:hypothetical protein AAFF_G00063910 [Aldrovandia affinis]
MGSVIRGRYRLLATARPCAKLPATSSFLHAFRRCRLAASQRLPELCHQPRVTSDCTGMCEIVLVRRHVDLPAVHGDPGRMGSGRPKAVTSTSRSTSSLLQRRLERLKRERQDQIKCSNVERKERNASQSGCLGSLSEKKDSKDRPRSIDKQSTHSLRPEQCPQQLKTHFSG